MCVALKSLSSLESSAPLSSSSPCFERPRHGAGATPFPTPQQAPLSSPHPPSPPGGGRGACWVCGVLPEPPSPPLLRSDVHCSARIPALGPQPGGTARAGDSLAETPLFFTALSPLVSCQTFRLPSSHAQSPPPRSPQPVCPVSLEVRS